MLMPGIRQVESRLRIKVVPQRACSTCQVMSTESLASFRHPDIVSTRRLPAWEFLFEPGRGQGHP